MLGADGRVRVLDFGLSRGRGVSSAPVLDVSRENLADLRVTAAGTPAYMSPEQFRGGEADAGSDQFSFCVAARGPEIEEGSIRFSWGITDRRQPDQRRVDAQDYACPLAISAIISG
ncbi:MAG: hypothetical protein IPO88_29945 [Nannocystis sp.]|uniref:hypothetical protein n=1 Tax=Nannocystis sp. TaxID=1962667 RepID=UPI002423D5FA|nr:hypothetical protein [Nannocystis sp.]MBK9757656.1 hypothetical protein [Nannocystis sp.]